jgi:pimeloyl-ACP methyl ester carboxylesterase
MPGRRSVLTIGAMLPALATLAAPAKADTPAKTYVLVHGAWHGAWCWSRVTPLLTAAGHRVVTPTQTGLGDRAHLLTRDIGLDTFVQDIVAAIEMEDLTNVILVGHSFGGASIIGAADRIPERIGHLVFLDGALLQNGQSVLSTVPPDIVTARIRATMETSAGVTLPVPSPDAFGVTDEQDAAWLTRHMRPHPFKTYVDKLPLAHPIGAGRPVTYIGCVKPAYPPLGVAHDYAKKAPGWTYQEIATGHDAMVLAPKALAEMLLAIA